MMRILILGHTGMLGNAVYAYLKQFYEIDIINYRWPSAEFIDYIKTYDGDYIINCIGAIPQKTNAFGINSILPVYLDLNVKCKIIHPATDCESDNDVYGISKRIASEWLLERGQHTYIFKTSIIGIELNSADSLLCWFLKQTNANGYTQAKWNGITTLEWAKQCKNIIENTHILEHTIFGTECVSKFELLNLIKDVFQHDIEITPIDGIGKDKCLVADIKLVDIKQQLVELKEFYKL
jgi:dTDP-4-dehydrorhamnose reductase